MSKISNSGILPKTHSIQAKRAQYQWSVVMFFCRKKSINRAVWVQLRCIYTAFRKKKCCEGDLGLVPCMLDRGICWVLIVGCFCRSLLSLPGCRVSVVECMLTVDCRVSLLVIAVVSWLSGCRGVGSRVNADSWLSGVTVGDRCRFLVVECQLSRADWW